MRSAASMHSGSSATIAIRTRFDAGIDAVVRTRQVAARQHGDVLFDEQALRERLVVDRRRRPVIEAALRVA